MAKLQGEIVGAWQDADAAWIAMAVTEPAPMGRVEYLARVPLVGRMDEHGDPLPDLADMSDADRLTVLLDAVKAVRTAQVEPTQPIAVAQKVIAL